MFFRRRRHRRWIALIALFGLLFQQLAMAAYVCPLDGRSDQGSISEAVKFPCHAPARSDLARCTLHCHPLAQVADHSPIPPIPAALLPATTWLRVLDTGMSHRGGHRHPEAFARAGYSPPLTIQHCTFQI